MYPYLWIRIRKGLKAAWNRYNSSKRERTASFSSLHECLDHQPARKGLWRNWFLLLLVAPLVYYVTFIRIIWDLDGPFSVSVSTAFRSDSKQQVAENVTTPFPKNYSETPETPQINKEAEHHRELYGSARIGQYDGSYYDFVSRMGIKLTKNFTTAKPWCEYKADAIQKTEVKLNDVTISQWYRQLVNKGGSFSPDFCTPRHKVAIIVPYRDRPSNLAVFLLTIHPFLIDQLLDYRIFVVEQSGKELFNKGRLLNAGFVEAMKLREWHCLIFHDVDLLPTNKLIMYSCPLWPRHMCPTLVDHGKTVWNFHSYFGGVSAMSVKHFMNVNGFSNLYWGWGGEDTDMFWRIRGAGLMIGRYQKDLAKYITLPHKKSPECENRNELIKTAIGRYPQDGLTTLKYKVVSMKLLHLYTHILVDINPSTENTTMAAHKNISVKNIIY